MATRRHFRVQKFRFVFVFLVLFCLAFLAAPRVCAGSENSKEYKIKAAFLYNFFKFIEWPKEKTTDSDTITIIIIGKNPFGKAFEPLKDRQVNDKKVIIKHFKSIEESQPTSDQIEAIRKCHVLFVCGSEKQQFRKIISLVKEHNVLTVGDTNGFLESGGIINFVIEEQKVYFEINNNAAKQEKLNIRSKLLRLAKKVVEENTSQIEKIEQVHYAKYCN